MGTDPLFLQIKRFIEDMILTGSLGPEEQIPSSTQLVAFHKMNHLTVLKGLNMLVDEQIIYKKRGVGMFVCADARQRIREVRQQQFMSEFIEPLYRESQKLGLTVSDLTRLIHQVSQKEAKDE